MRRAGSGYHDDELSLPAGHLDGGEDVKSTLVRELAEELTITVEPGACRLCVIAHRAPQTAEDDEYLDFFFAVDRWTGTPTIGEPNQCSELVWADPQQLPADVIDYIRKALRARDAGELLVLDGWNSKPSPSP
jgi:8-oxo-dGTP pyrophosphatase MutT (NUDIX family)